MTAGKVRALVRDYLPSILLAGFGFVLVYLAATLSAVAAGSSCSGGAALQACNPHSKLAQVETISFFLLLAGVGTLAVSGILALIILWRRERRAAAVSSDPGETD